MEFAIKTLKKDASEEEKVKFLQEAAMHHGSVQPFQHCQTTWSGHCGRTIEQF